MHHEQKLILKIFLRIELHFDGVSACGGSQMDLRQGLGYLTCRISSTAKYHQRQQQGRAAAYPLHVS